jgi:ribokinase
MRNNVVVVGSFNTDLTIKTGRIPRPGETVIGGVFSRGGGGKGANQAVAAARAGAEVHFVARVGNDSYGREGMDRLRGERVNTDRVVYDQQASTGVAFIVVDERGENSIVVAGGANAHLVPSDIEAAGDAFDGAGVLLVQLESPLPAVQTAIRLARRAGALVLLNPAPGQPLAKEFLSGVDIITPNKLEAEMITGMKITDDSSLRAAARAILDCGVGHVIVTLGRRGIVSTTKSGAELIPAYPVSVVDSTGAGDVFSGALAAFLAGGIAVDEAARKAVAAASLSVTRMGAQFCAPIRPELDAFIRENAGAHIEMEK